MSTSTRVTSKEMEWARDAHISNFLAVPISRGNRRKSVDVRTCRWRKRANNRKGEQEKCARQVMRVCVIIHFRRRRHRTVKTSKRGRDEGDIYVVRVFACTEKTRGQQRGKLPQGIRAGKWSCQRGITEEEEEKEMNSGNEGEEGTERASRSRMLYNAARRTDFDATYGIQHMPQYRSSTTGSRLCTKGPHPLRLREGRTCFLRASRSTRSTETHLNLKLDLAAHLLMFPMGQSESVTAWGLSAAGNDSNTA